MPDQDIPEFFDQEWPPPPYLRPLGGERPIAPRRARHFDGLTYATIPGFRPLLMDVHVPDGAENPPVVLWIHGGAWLMGDRRLPPAFWPVGLHFQKIVDAGYALATIDYRHSKEAPFPAQLHDAKAALRYLRRFAGDLGIDAGRVVVWGESAGGHLAALVGLTGGQAEWDGEEGVGAGDTTVSAVVDWYGVHDASILELRGMPFDLPALPASHVETLSREPLGILAEGSPLGDDALRLCSPITHVRGDAPPFLLVHGEADALVPIVQSEVFAAALTEAGASVELRRVPGADHAWLGIDPTPLMDASLAWIDATVPATPAVPA